MFKTLRLVGLSKEYYNRFPNQLSGGQRQRVAIARAIILKPQILICDEPTSALDVTIQSQILDLLNDLKTKLNITIILISHDISVVKYFSDRIIVMYNGEIIEMGNTNNVINIPKDKYTKRLMSSVFSLKKKWYYVYLVFNFCIFYPDNYPKISYFLTNISTQYF